MVRRYPRKTARLFDSSFHGSMVLKVLNLLSALNSPANVRQPRNLSAPNEYGFYANVNPHVDHPRWSQATERFIGSGGILDVQRQPTLLFNGYANEVASLYRGLNLRENF